MHRFRAPRDELRRGRVRLRGAELHHLRDVLRLRPGARVGLFDGEGGNFLAEVSAVKKTEADLTVLRPLGEETESPLSLTLAMAIAKGTKLDWVIEKGTELGVSHFVPFTSKRTIPSPGDFAPRVARWRRIASAGAAQCGRTISPEVSAVTSLPKVLDVVAERKLFFWEAGGSPLARPPGEATRSALLVTGPEGGFTADEAAQAEQAGFTLAALGPRILRAETAAVAAVTLAQFFWGDLRQSPSE